MSLQIRVEKLSRQAGVGTPCPVCDGAPREVEMPGYDENIWAVGKSYELNINCVHCGGPRRIVIDMIERRDGAEN